MTNTQLREIKYQVWDSENKRMLEVTQITWSVQNKGRMEVYSVGKVNNPILREWTGLKDKNGKEVFEGDILQWKPAELKEDFDEKRERYLVEFKQGKFVSNWQNKDYGDIYETIKTDDCYVIGNLYENPELLREKGGEE